MKRLGVLLLLAATAASADVNGVVLRIGDRIATLYDYRQRYAERLRAIQARDVEPERQAELQATAGRTAFCELFQEMLVLARADQQRLEVSDEQVDEAEAQSKTNLGIETEEQFADALRSSSLTEEKLREQLRRSLLVQQVMGSQLRDRVQLDEEDLRRFYQSHLESFQVPRRLRLQEVVVLAEGRTPEETSRLAAEVRSRAAAGEGLAAAAAASPPGAVTQIIDLGWVSSGDLDAGLEAAVWEIAAGAFSEPVAGRGGLHVVEVLEIEEAHVQPFSEVSDAIEAGERQRLIDREMGSFLRELTESSYIVEQPPPEAVGYRDSCLAGDTPAEPQLAAPTRTD